MADVILLGLSLWGVKFEPAIPLPVRFEPAITLPVKFEPAIPLPVKIK